MNIIKYSWVFVLNEHTAVTMIAGVTSTFTSNSQNSIGKVQIPDSMLYYVGSEPLAGNRLFQLIEPPGPHDHSVLSVSTSQNLLFPIAYYRHENHPRKCLLYGWEINTSETFQARVTETRVKQCILRLYCLFSHDKIFPLNLSCLSQISEEPFCRQSVFL